MLPDPLDLRLFATAAPSEARRWERLERARLPTRSVRADHSPKR